MEVMIVVSMVLLPLVLFGAALGLRIAADAQSEASWTGPRRRWLFVMAYLFLGIGLFVLLGTALLGRPLALIPFVMFSLASFQLAEAEFQLMGTRRRTQEAELLWMLATSVASQRDLAADLEAYARGTWGKRHQQLIELSRRLRAGLPPSELAVPQGLLSRDASFAIQSGLQSGKLKEALRDEAIRQTRLLTVGDQPASAHASLTYPAAILTVMLVVVGYLLYFIIPKFKKIFDDFSTELPRLTVALIKGSDEFIDHWYLCSPIVFVLAGIVFVAAMSHCYGWKALWQWSAGRWIVRPHSAEVLRSLAGAVGMGVPLDRGLDLFVSSVNPMVVQRRMAAVRLAISQGEPCWQVLAREGFLKDREVVLIEAAQRAGNLPWALNTLADNLDRRLNFRIIAALEVLRPFIVVCLGIVVGLVAIAMFLPLVKLVSDLS